MARKPLEGSNIDNVLKYGTGGINIDGCRIQGDDTGGEEKSQLVSLEMKIMSGQMTTLV